MEKRFERNIPTISEEEQEILKSSRMAIIGLGGLGGYLCEMVARLGVGSLVVCDCDVFDETNLNRQLLSSPGNIGMLKAESALGWIKAINPSANVDMYCQDFTSDNALEILAGCDLVLDGLDNPCTRLILEDACAELNIPIIHGAIQGLTAQVGVALPCHNMLHKLFSSKACTETLAESGACSKSSGKDSISIDTCAESSGIDSTIATHDKESSLKSTLVCTPAFCASLQIAQAVTLLCKKESSLTDKLLIANLDSADFNILPLA